MTPSLADEILRRLIEAGDTPLSGQRLASGLGVTRAAVWKGVESLRGNGYRVSSEPSKGYRLESKPRGVRPGEVSASLRTRRLGRPIRHLPRVDSTNREAARWAAEGGPEGALVVAEFQEVGRGRLGRSWFGLPGKSLAFSLVLRPDVPAGTAPLLTFVASVALADMLAAWVPAESIEIKWPNDVLLQGRKAAGILLEMHTEGQRVGHVVLGVGLNVEGTSADYPVELRSTAVTVAEVSPHRCPDRLSALCRFLEVFEEAYEVFLGEGFRPLSDRWNRWTRMQGRAVRVCVSGGVLEGVARGMGDAGELLLERAPGELTPIFAGDVEFATTRET